MAHTSPLAVTAQMAAAVVAGTLLSGAAAAAVIEAESGSSVDLQAAIDRAQPGDIVQVPAGKFDFEGFVNAPDGIHIRGAGRDETFLIKIDRVSMWDAMINVDCTTQQPFIFSDISLQGLGRFIQGDSNKKGPVRDQGLNLLGKCVDFQVYNSRFTKFTRAGIEVFASGGSAPGEPRGVIYDNQFFDIWYPNNGYGIEVIGVESSWDLPLDLGSSRAVFIEDNYFELIRHTVAANNGARYVFRNNTVRNNYDRAAMIDAHGKADAWPRGTRSYEIYNNVIQNEEERWAAVGLRGGDGVVFDNEFSGVKFGVLLMIEEYSFFDRYPKDDQIRDIWIWDNIVNGRKLKDVDFWARQKGVGRLLKKNRDYYLGEKPDYVPYPYPHPLRANQGT